LSPACARLGVTAKGLTFPDLAFGLGGAVAIALRYIGWGGNDSTHHRNGRSGNSLIKERCPLWHPAGAR
jgi:hypothetical protein